VGPAACRCGLTREQSAISLLAAEAPHGGSEHNARTARWSAEVRQLFPGDGRDYRFCMALKHWWCWVRSTCEHPSRWLQQSDVQQFLFENTGVPLRCYREEEPGEGTAAAPALKEITSMANCVTRSSAHQNRIRIVVAGRTAGNFPAVLGSWSTRPRGSQMVTYRFEERKPITLVNPLNETPALPATPAPRLRH